MITIREAARDDDDAIKTVLVAAYRQYEPDLPPGGIDVYLRDLCALVHRRAVSTILVAEEVGRPVGTATFYLEARDEGLEWPAGWAGVRAVGVEPTARGKGVARALMDESVARAKAAGSPVLCLHTASFMPVAMRLYERMGFRRVPEHDYDISQFFPPSPEGTVVILGYALDL